MTTHTGHRATDDLAERGLRTAFLLTLVILAVEGVAGVFSHSLALLSDAGHVLTDLIALGLAWFAKSQARRPSDASRTYGHHRTGILAALANALTLILIVVWIAFEAAQRLRHPQPVMPWLMFVAAAVGIAANLYIGLALRDHGRTDLNVRAAVLHVSATSGRRQPSSQTASSSSSRRGTLPTR